MITLEMLKERLKLYQDQLTQVQAQANAYEGAIQDCQFWIEQLEKDAEE
jgi:hypothetical protein